MTIGEEYYTIDNSVTEPEYPVSDNNAEFALDMMAIRQSARAEIAEILPSIPAPLPSPSRGSRVSSRYESAETDSLREYLITIGRVTLLTKDQEVALAEKIEDGRKAEEELKISLDVNNRELADRLRRTTLGQLARESFVAANYRLVVAIAKKYQRHSELDDLIQAGNMGLMHAVEKFDGQRGFKFSTYATWWIRQSITRSIAMEGSLLRIPDKARGPIPSIVASLDATFSSNSPQDFGSEGTLTDVIPDQNPGPAEDVIVEISIPQRIDALLQDFLDERERTVVEWHFGLKGEDPLSHKEIAEKLGLSLGRVGQIQARAIAQLKNNCDPMELRELLSS